MQVEHLHKMVKLVDPKVTEYIKKLEPITLGPFAAGIVNLTEVQIVNITHSSFAIYILPDEGLSVSMGGFAAALVWTIKYDYFGEWEYYTSVASLNDTNISFSFKISSEQGAPVVVISDDQIYIGILDVGKLPYEFLRDFLDYILRSVINYEAPSFVISIANTDIAKLIPQLWTNGTKLLGGELLVNYTLTQPPVFANQFATFYIDGSLNITSSGVKTCPYTRKALPDIPVTEDFQVTLDLSIVECILYQFALQQLSSTVSFHGMLSLDISLSQAPLITIVNELVSASIGLEVKFYRGSDSELWLGLVGNETTALKIEMKLTNQTGRSQVNISFPVQPLQVDSFLCTGVNPQIPQRYRDQIQQEDWAGVVAKVNALIASQLKGKLPPSIQLPIQDNVAEVLIHLSNLRFVSTQESLGVLLDFDP